MQERNKPTMKQAILIITLLIILGCKDNTKDVNIVAYTSSSNQSYLYYLDGEQLSDVPYSRFAPSCSNTNTIKTVKPGSHKLYIKHVSFASFDREKVIHIPVGSCYSIDCTPF